MLKNWCLWCWRRLLRVPWIVRRPNQSILKEISPEYSSEGLRLKLKRSNSLANSWEELTEKTLMLRKIKGRRTMGWQSVRWLDCITDTMDMSLSKLWETAKNGEVWNATVHGITKSRPRQPLNNNRLLKKPQFWEWHMTTGKNWDYPQPTGHNVTLYSSHTDLGQLINIESWIYTCKMWITGTELKLQ